nr:flagellin [uncultured Halomonas sp.]
MSVINTNITSLIAQQNLNASKSDLTTAMERLSSGLRINSAADDAAGQAIANRMSAQITGLSQAQRNANDGISVAQTTEGALNQVNDNLQRIRELTVQAQNGTNSPEDLASIQDEITARLDEIGRVSEETSFNGVKVLASDQTISIQVGANDGETIDIKLSEINAETLGLTGFNVDGTGADNAAATVTDIQAAGFTKQADGSYDSATGFNRDATIADTFGTLEDGGTVTDTAATTTYTYSAASETFSFDETGRTDTAGAALESTLTPAGGETKTITYTNGGETQDITIDSDGNITDAASGNVLYIDTTTGDLSETNGAGNTAATADSLTTYFSTAAATTNGAVIADGDTTYTATAADTYDVAGDTISKAELQQNLDGVAYTLDSENDGTDDFSVATTGVVSDGTGATQQYISGFDDSTFVDSSQATVYANDNGTITDGAANEVFVKEDGSLTFDAVSDATATENPLAALDAALSQVDGLRSDLGALQNRFDSAITNLATTEINLTAARSRIQDADYATEVSNMTRNQILQQAGTSILAQANQLPQSVLSLLG